jgi:CRISPR-associated protein Csy1
LNNSTHGLSTVIVQYITARGQDKLDKLDKEIVKFKASANSADQAKVEQLEQKRRDEQEKFIPANWLTDAARRAGQLQLVTHAPKFTHSDAKASGLFATSKQQGANADGTLCTASIKKPAIDVIGNAAALDVGKLLQLSFDDKALIDYVGEGDVTPLSAIANNNELAKQWLAGFKLAISSENVSSHKLSKQVYWPVDDESEEQQYHLLAPLFASSLQHNIYQTINSIRFADIAKTAKDARRNKKASDVPVINIPDVAEQHFGGTKPQNISQLNSQRYGKGYLLDASAPKWQTIAKPPLNVNTIFGGIFNYRAGRLGRNLRFYLESVFERPSTIDIRDERAQRIDEIINQFFAYVSDVYEFEAGWSADVECVLPIAEKLLLDPRRQYGDKIFAEHWQKKEWPGEIADGLAKWINRQLEGVKHKSEKLAPGKVEYLQWRKLIERKISIFIDDIGQFYIEPNCKDLN